MNLWGGSLIFGPMGRNLCAEARAWWSISDRAMEMLTNGAISRSKPSIFALLRRRFNPISWQQHRAVTAGKFWRKISLLIWGWHILLQPALAPIALLLFYITVNLFIANAEACDLLELTTKLNCISVLARKLVNTQV